MAQELFSVVLVLVTSVNFVVNADVDQSAVDIIQDIYYGCLRDFSLTCAKPKALQWLSDVYNNEKIRITDDLLIVKKDNPGEMEVFSLK